MRNRPRVRRIQIKMAGENRDVKIEDLKEREMRYGAKGLTEVSTHHGWETPARPASEETHQPFFGITVVTSMQRSSIQSVALVTAVAVLAFTGSNQAGIAADHRRGNDQRDVRRRSQPDVPQPVLEHRLVGRLTPRLHERATKVSGGGFMSGVEPRSS